MWGLVKIDPAMLDTTLERVHISLPRRVLHRLDARARSAGETRSGFIARTWRLKDAKRSPAPERAQPTQAGCRQQTVRQCWRNFQDSDICNAKMLACAL